MKTAHKVQLLEVTPDVKRELLALDKIEIVDENKLPLGESIKLESAKLFDGRPIKFLSDGKTMYLCNIAEEMGGMVEYTYLVPLEGTKTSNTTDYLTVAVAEQTMRRKKQLEECERICRGVATRVKKQLEQQQIIEFERLKKDAKRFIREGQKGYQTAQVQMLSYILQSGKAKNVILENNTSLENCLAKIESASEKLLNYRCKYTSKAKIEDRPAPQKGLDPDVVRIKGSDKIAQFLSSETEIQEGSELESVQESQDHLGVSQEIKSKSVTEFKNRFESKVKTATIKHSVVKKGDKQKNDKSNSEGVEKS